MSSVYTDLLTQMKAAVEAIDVDGTCLIRKRVIHHENDATHLTLLVPQKEREIGVEGSEQELQIEYPVLVIRKRPTGNLLDGASQTAMFDDRQLLRRTLRSVSLLAPTGVGETIVDVKADLDPVFDERAFPDNIDVSGMLITYTVSEPRAV